MALPYRAISEEEAEALTPLLAAVAASSGDRDKATALLKQAAHLPGGGSRPDVAPSPDMCGPSDRQRSGCACLHAGLQLMLTHTLVQLMLTHTLVQLMLTHTLVPHPRCIPPAVDEELLGPVGRHSLRCPLPQCQTWWAGGRCCCGRATHT